MNSEEPRVLLAATGHDAFFTHAVLWGAGSMTADPSRRVRLGWTGGLAPAPVISGVELQELATAVRNGARRAEQSDSWIQARLPHEPARALFSPRIKAVPDLAAWTAWKQERGSHLGRLVDQQAWLDLRLAAALGEPSSWHQRDGTQRQDDAASRLEMQPRNQGSEFVGTLVRKLARSVAARSLDDVASGLAGTLHRDEAATDPPESRSAANLRSPGPTDNALAWTAVWGLASVPVVHQVRGRSLTATHIPWFSGLGDDVRAGHVVAPMWTGGWTIARLRSVLASRALIRRGAAALSPDADQVNVWRDEQWLGERGLHGLVVFPVRTLGSTSSPERRVLTGRAVRLGKPR